MRSHLDTSSKTKCPATTSPSMQWQSMTKNKHAPHMCNLRTTKYHNISHHQQRQCPLHLPDPRLPRHSAYTQHSTICTWNPLPEMWNWRQFRSESWKKIWKNPRKFQKFLPSTANENSWLRDQAPEPICITPEQFEAEIHIFITHILHLSYIYIWNKLNILYGVEQVTPVHVQLLWANRFAKPMTKEVGLCTPLQNLH